MHFHLNRVLGRQRAWQAATDRRAAPPEPQGGLAKGQTTAIVTGVVSILFGVRRRPDALCTALFVLWSAQDLLCRLPATNSKEPEPGALQVAYLALVQLMDSRGDQLMPPPPEAFGL